MFVFVYTMLRSSTNTRPSLQHWTVQLTHLGHDINGEYNSKSVWSFPMQCLMCISANDSCFLRADETEVFDPDASLPNKRRFSALRKVAQHWKTGCTTPGGSTVCKDGGTTSCHRCKEVKESLGLDFKYFALSEVFRIVFCEVVFSESCTRRMF